VSWVSRADLAEGTARLLLEGGRAGEALGLTGPAAPTLAEVAAMQERGFRLVRVEEYVAGLEAAGRGADFAREWATTYEGVARGEFGRVDPLLGDLLGRPPRSMAEVLADRGSSPAP
jgi:hypothetical protein